MMNKLTTLLIAFLLIPGIALAQMSVQQGGTGRNSFTPGAWIYANSDAFQRLTGTTTPSFANMLFGNATGTNATTTRFAISSILSSLLKTDGNGSVIPAIAGTDYFSLASQIDHGGLTGLSDDDHTQYALLTGRGGGQVLYGGTAANNDLTLDGTSHSTKTSSYVLLQPTGGNVGIGITAPTARFQVATDAVVPHSSLVDVNDGFFISFTGATSLRSVSSNDTANVGNNFTFVRSRGTPDAPTISVDGDRVMQIIGQGYDGTTRRTMGSLRFEIDGDPGSNDMPGRLVFTTSPDGSSTVATRMTIKSTGLVGVGPNDPVSLLDVNSSTGAIATLRRFDTSIGANDMIGKLQFYAADTSTATNFIVADIEAQAVNTITTDINPGRLIFRTTGTSVGATPTEALRITETQNVGIGTSTPAAKLQVHEPTATSTVYITSGGAGLGGRVILEDEDGAGCTQVTALNGVLTASIVTCP